MLQRGDGASAEATTNKEPYAVVQGGFFSSCQQVKVNANPDNFFQITHKLCSPLITRIFLPFADP